MRRSSRIGALIIIFIIVVISTFSYVSGHIYKPPVVDQGLNSPGSTALVKITCSDGRYCTFIADVADTPEKQATGLMNRISMAKDSGMLFIFEGNVEHYFWMKDTLIPLDMIFIDQEGKIINIHKNATPLSLDMIPSSGPCKYVLEVNGGTCEYKNIRTGDRAIIE